MKKKKEIAQKREIKLVMKRSICRWLFEAWGWTLEVPPAIDRLKKFIIVVAPHTSNWDFPVGLLVRCQMGRDFRFIAKSSLFRPPFGWLFRALGGYPVDRSKSQNFVDAVVDIFNDKEEFVITITPEGTRKKVNRWKTGFYHIARGAHIPLVMCSFDWGHKIVRFSEPFYPNGNLEEDFEQIRDFFQGVLGKHPEQGFV